MQIPPFLQPGSLVALAAPARWVQPAQIQQCIAQLQAAGLRVHLPPDLHQQHHIFGGADEERARQLNQLLADPGISAILFARGGYGSMRIVNRIDWQLLRRHPKWLCGFSDITVLLNAAAANGVAALHGPLAFSYGVEGNEVATARELAFLLGDVPGYVLPAHPLNRPGTATGRVAGGNLSLLNNLTGTPYFPKPDGCLLLLEDVGEYLYHTDRMLRHLDLAGYLAGLAGLLVGSFTDMKDNEDIAFGQSVEEIILGVAGKYGYPIAFGVPSGHQAANWPVPVGATATLKCSTPGSTLAFQLTDTTS